MTLRKGQQLESAGWVFFANEHFADAGDEGEDLWQVPNVRCKL
jgi:hypothetical protein